MRTPVLRDSRTNESLARVVLKPERRCSYDNLGAGAQFKFWCWSYGYLRGSSRSLQQHFC